MKKIIGFFLMILLLGITTGYPDSSWVEQTVPGDYVISDIQFLDADIGFYCAFDANGYWGKTTDGGNNWVEMDCWGSSSRFCLHFFNEDHGIIAGFWFMPGRVWGAIAITFDGGSTFQWLNEPETHELYFRDSLHGWSVGFAAVEYTSDGGLTWLSLDYFSAYDICFSDSLHGWAVGYKGYPYRSRLIYSSDAGMSWSEDTILTNNTVPLYGISFPDSLNGWIVGDSGEIFHTTDGGINWTQQNSGVTRVLRDVYFYNENIGWIAGYFGTLLKTTNGGNEWINQNLNTYNDLYTIFFLDSLKGWVGGEDIILHTECGGSSVEEEVSTLNPLDNYVEIKPMRSSQNYQISFQLSMDSYVRIEIFNILGQKIKTLTDEYKNAGQYEIFWNGRDDHGIPVLSGSYFLRFESGDFRETKSLIVIR